MAKRSSVITMSPIVLDEEHDLDLWEIVNPSDGEYSDDSFSIDSFSDDDVIFLDDASTVSPSVISPPLQILPGSDGGDLAADLDLDVHIDGDGDGDGDGDDVFRDEVDDSDLGLVQRRTVFLGGDSRYSVGITYGDYVNSDGCYDDSDEDDGGDDGEYDDSYDLDEELVPRKVSGKLGSQRMRKLGKRAIAKVLTSKKSPYSHLKPGCVRGKHVLGMKFRC